MNLIAAIAAVFLFILSGALFSVARDLWRLGDHAFVAVFMLCGLMCALMGYVMAHLWAVTI